jgi:hypothetical protein
VPNRRILRAALLAFLVSRLLVFGVIVAGSQIAFLGKVYSNSVWETRIVLQPERVRPELERIVLVGDAWWYRSIAVDGYDRARVNGRPANWAFFPLYPLLVRALPVTEASLSTGCSSPTWVSSSLSF